MTTQENIVAVCALLELVLMPVLVVGIVLLVRETVLLGRDMKMLERTLKK